MASQTGNQHQVADFDVINSQGFNESGSLESGHPPTAAMIENTETVRQKGLLGYRNGSVEIPELAESEAAVAKIYQDIDELTESHPETRLAQNLRAIEPSISSSQLIDEDAIEALLHGDREDSWNKSIIKANKTSLGAKLRLIELFIQEAKQLNGNEMRLFAAYASVFTEAVNEALDDADVRREESTQQETASLWQDTATLAKRKAEADAKVAKREAFENLVRLRTKSKEEMMKRRRTGFYLSSLEALDENSKRFNRR